MAQSPAHRLGQIIGERLENAIQEPLQEVANEFGLYLDYKHVRPARGGKRKVSWKDSRGNVHDLDYVLEEGGSEDILGRPRAFIESAWRRYTKHSRNKAQEIQGAITPLAETYRDSNPFLGVVLGGVFTEGSLEQFRSHKFKLIYCSYASIAKAFASEGVDICWSEKTSEKKLESIVRKLEKLTSRKLKRISEEICRAHAEQFDAFFESIRSSLGRQVERISIVALSGIQEAVTSIVDAIRFVEQYDEASAATEFVRYELNVRYSNGDEVRGMFQEKNGAVEFLRSLG